MAEKRSEPCHHGRKDSTNYTQCYMLHKMQLSNPTILYTCRAQNVTYSGQELK